MLGNNPNIADAFTYSKNGIVTASYLEDAVSQGLVFQVQKRFSVPAGIGSEYCVVLDTTPLVGSNKRLFTMPQSMKTSAGLVFCDTYSIPSFTGGTPVAIAKINELSTIMPLSKAYKGATPSGSPAEPIREYVVGTKSTNQSSGVSSFTPDIAKQFPAGTILVSKFTNQETFIVTVEFEIIFVEA